MGASEKPDRYANMAIRRLRAAGMEVVAHGLRLGQVGDVSIQTHLADLDVEGLHTITLYLSPANQQPYQEFIRNLNPQRVIFNPGTENPDFERELRAVGVETLQACTLVMLGTGQY